MAEDDVGGTGIGAEVFMAVLAVLTGGIAALFASAAFSGPTTQWPLFGGFLAFGFVSAFFILIDNGNSFSGAAGELSLRPIGLY